MTALTFTPMYWLFVVAALVQCEYALYIFSRILFMRAGRPLPPTRRSPVSIIICARNEAENLTRYLPAVLQQNYTDAAGNCLYEVIVADDASADDTPVVLAGLARTYPHLRVITISPGAPRNMPGKKFALSQGLAQARHPWLLLTDADCEPAGKDWISYMAAPLAAGRQIVAGYGGYCQEPGLLNAFVRWETLHTFLQYSTYALGGRPYMAVGRNMACTSQVLAQAMQSPVWAALPSGDDDLLVSIAGNKHNTAVVSHRSAFTYTLCRPGWQSWAAQKQRHLSTGKYYQSAIKLMLGAYGMSHAVLWLSFFVLLLFAYSPSVLYIMAARCLLYWLLWLATAHRLGEKKLFYLFPAADMGWMIYNFAFFPYIALKNKKNWT